MEPFLQDLRFAFRTLRKSPAFTAIAIVCLALGIATNTTLFSVFDAILLKPFPFTQPERLVSLWERNPKSGGRNSISYLNYRDWRAQSTKLADIGAYSGRSAAITEGDEPERLSGELVSGNLFPMLGITPQLGRLFRADEDKSGAPGVVLLSDGVWRRRYLSDSTVIGRVVSINNLAYTVVGVMPPKFKFPQSSEIWMPMAPVLHDEKRDVRSVAMVARLKDGATIAQADQEIAEIAKRVNAQYGIVSAGANGTALIGSARELRKDFIPPDVSLITAITSAVRGAIRAADPAIPVFQVRTMEKVRQLSFWQYGLFGIMFAVFGVIALFLAAIGVYGVISYGVSQRTREIGLRVALGAQARDVIGLVVWQGMSLAGIGIALGLAGALGVTQVVSSMLIGVSPTGAASFLGVSAFLAIVALIASVIPARRATGVYPIVALRAE